MFVKINKKEFAALAAIVLIFLAASYFSNYYFANLKNLIGLKSGAGMILYIFIIVFGVVIAPVSALPFLPVAVVLWGPVLASILSISGWTAGAAIAFGLSRRFGRPLITKIINIKKLEQLEALIPKNNLFGMVIFLRIFLPVDILSYALGLFSNMRWPSYLLATFIGITPFAFAFSYGSTFPLRYQIIIGLIGIILFILYYNRLKNKVLKRI